MRIGIACLMHESNTFAPRGTGLEQFQADTLAEGEAARARFAGTHHEVGGFLARAEADGHDAVMLFAGWTLPGGTISRAAAWELTRRVCAAIGRAGHLDGLYLAAHGAAVAEGFPDFDGHWMTAARSMVPKGIPVVATLDLHANLSAAMAASADAIFAYRSNPHLDMRQTGEQAASLLNLAMAGKARPVTAAVFPPMAVNIEAQATAESPCLELQAKAEEMRRMPGVLSVAVLLGFPYADVAEMGAAATVTTDGDPVLARRLADELGRWWWDRREAYRGRLVSPSEAVARAASAPGPVCLLDMGDNVGGGSPADSTHLAAELSRQGVGPAFACIHDPEAAEAAAGVGTGGEILVPVGGKTDDRHGAPLPGPFRVISLHDGKYEETEARHGGIRHFDQGPTAVVTRGALTIMLTSRRCAPFSLRQLTAFGIDPARFRVLVAKGVHAPVAAYAPVCPTLIRVNTPGVTTADMDSLGYSRRRRPLYPLEPEAAWPS